MCSKLNSPIYYYVLQWAHNDEAKLQRLQKDASSELTMLQFYMRPLDSGINTGGLVIKILVTICFHNVKESLTINCIKIIQQKDTLRQYIYTRSLGALRAPTSSWGPFGPPWLRPSRPSGAQAVWPTLLLAIRFCSRSLPMMIITNAGSTNTAHLLTQHSW